MRPLHCLLWQYDRKANKGWRTHAPTFQNGVNIKQHLLCQQKLHHAYTATKSGFPLTKMTVCPAVSSQKAKPSAHPRTEQANKVHTSSLTPALTGLWVGFCPDVSHFLQATQWKGHICCKKKKKKADWDFRCRNTTRKKMSTPILLNTLFKVKLRICPGPWNNWKHPEEVNYFLQTSEAEFKGYLVLMAWHLHTDHYIFQNVSILKVKE